MNKNKSKAKYFLLKTLLSILVALIFVVKLFPYHFVLVVGHSMEPTYHDKEFVLAEFKHITNPERGHVYIIHHNNDIIIKRVKYIEGDVIYCGFDDDEYISEDWANKLSQLNLFKFHIQLYTLKHGEMFVLGDNSNNSEDSRTYGVLSTGEIKAEVLTK